MANPDPLPLLKRPQVAELLGVSARAVTRWEAEEGFPVTGPTKTGQASQYNATAVVAWYVAHELQRVTGGVSGGLNPSRELARKNKARADLDEQQHGVRSGALIPRSEFQRVLGKVVTEIRAKLLAAPRAWAVALVKAAAQGPAAVERLLMQRIREVLEALAALEVDKEKAP